MAPTRRSFISLRALDVAFWTTLIAWVAPNAAFHFNLCGILEDNLALPAREFESGSRGGLVAGVLSRRLVPSLSFQQASRLAGHEARK